VLAKGLLNTDCTDADGWKGIAEKQRERRRGTQVGRRRFTFAPKLAGRWFLFRDLGCARAQAFRFVLTPHNPAN